MNIVLIHGIAGSGRFFKNLEAYLKSRLEVNTFALDLHGFGKNSKDSGSFSLEEHIDSITRQIYKTFPQGKLVLLGHSAGGVLAIEFVRRNISRIKALILLNVPLAETSHEVRENILNNKNQLFDWGYLILKYPKLSFIACKFLCKLNLMRTVKFLKPIYIPSEVFKDYRFHSWKSLLRSFENIIINHPARAILSGMPQNLPILNIIANNDNPLMKKSIYQKNIINKEFSGGHLLLLENPKVTYQTIENFLKDLES